MSRSARRSSDNANIKKKKNTDRQKYEEKHTELKGMKKEGIQHLYVLISNGL